MYPPRPSRHYVDLTLVLRLWGCTNVNPPLNQRLVSAEYMWRDHAHIGLRYVWNTCGRLIKAVYCIKVTGYVLTRCCSNVGQPCINVSCQLYSNPVKISQWPNVVLMQADFENSRPTLKQHWVNVLFLLVSDGTSYVWRGVYCWLTGCV